MLKQIRSLYEYRDYLDSEKENLSLSDLKRLSSLPYKKAIHKLRKLDVGLADSLLSSLYSKTGRPAIDPSTLLRSFILMQHLNYYSLHRWYEALSNDLLLQYLIGASNIPSVSSHYDFIVRLTGIKQKLDELYPKDYYKKPPKEKPKRNEKLINYSHTDTYYLYERYKDGASCDNDRYSYNIQSLFNLLAVIPSMDKGLIDNESLVLSGDGSSLHIHASKFGHKVKDGEDKDNIYRFSAPDADIGWDSDLECFYLGYTFYNVSCHNKERSIDLPVFISIEKASRNDALTSISAFAQLFELNQDLHPKYVCLDSASDSLPIYQYFKHNHIIPLIDRNKRRHVDLDKTNGEYINADGIPVCKANEKMIFFGYDIQRCRSKFRCPLAMGKIESCECKEQCSNSKYGRVKYVNDGDDARNIPIVYRSDKWKKIYKNRTSTERINNYVLNTYGLHKMSIRNGAKQIFFSIMAGINIHLDAWIKEDNI